MFCPCHGAARNPEGSAALGIPVCLRAASARATSSRPPPPLFFSSSACRPASAFLFCCRCLFSVNWCLPRSAPAPMWAAVLMPWRPRRRLAAQAPRRPAPCTASRAPICALRGRGGLSSGRPGHVLVAPLRVSGLPPGDGGRFKMAGAASGLASAGAMAVNRSSTQRGRGAYAVHVSQRRMHVIRAWELVCAGFFSAAPPWQSFRHCCAAPPPALYRYPDDSAARPAQLLWGVPAT